MDQDGAQTGVLGQRRLERRDHLVARIDRDLNSHLSNPRGVDLGTCDLHRREAGGVISSVKPASDDDDRVCLEQRPVLLEGLLEHHHLDGGLQVFEDHRAEQLAVPGVPRPVVGHHSRHCDIGRVGSGRCPLAQGPQVRDAHIGEALEHPLHPHQWVVGDVEAKHLLFEGKAGHLLELNIGDIDLGAMPVCVVAPLLFGGRGEERRDASINLLATIEGLIDDRLRHQGQTLTGVAHRVEPTRLDQ